MPAQDSRRQEEKPLLIQLGAARSRGSVERVITGGVLPGQRDASGQRPSFPILIQPDQAKPQELPGRASKGNRAQEFGASVDPLYLFSCAVSWHRERDAGAGWELVQFLRSQDKGSRAVAAALLARTEHARLLVRDLRRARVHMGKPAERKVEHAAEPGLRKVDEMNTPYGLEIIESCLTCKLRKDHWFCGFSTDALKMLNVASHLSTYPGGAVLFVE